MNQPRSTDIIAGLSVFLSMLYVAFANPVLMSTAGKNGYGMSGVAVFFATCLMAAFATWASGRYAGSSAALAPGLALSAVLSSFLTAPDTTITWESALVICFVAGISLLILSETGGRRQIIDSIPPVIKKAIMAGIGSILAKAALDFVVKYPGNGKLGAVIFSVGLVVIVVGYFGLRGLSIKLSGTTTAKILDMAGRASFIGCIVLLSVLVWQLDPATLSKVPTGHLFAWSDSKLTWGQIFEAATRWEALPLLVLVFYILLIDIIGSPYHLASSDRASYDATPFGAEEEKRISRSFRVDSLANVAAPVVGATPVVYYAENFTAKVLGSRSAVVAYVVAGGFVLLFAVGLALWANSIPLTSLVPQIAVAPVLFVVGLIIMSESLKPEQKPAATAAAGDKSAALSSADIDLIELVPRIPAPLAIVLTPIAGFEIGIAAGILFYAAFQWMIPQQTSDTGDKGKSEHDRGNVTLFLIATALIAVGIKIKLFFGS